MRWTVVIPTRSLPEAKSRLLPASADAEAHRLLVRAIRTDTVAAALAAVNVARVLLVLQRASDASLPGVRTVVQQHEGLDGAASDGAAHAAREWPRDGVAVMVGDLPALRPGELAAALAAAARHPSAFVPDADGTGTTVLTAVPGTLLTPRFGAGSARRHEAHAQRIEAGLSLRTDVDTVADLTAARLIGLGPATTAVLAGRAATTGSPARSRTGADGAGPHAR